MRFALSTIVLTTALAGCVTPTPATRADAFPALGTTVVVKALGKTKCSGAAVARSAPVRTHDGLAGHPVLLCDGAQALGHAVFWSGTNSEGTRLVTHPTDVNGAELHVDGGDYDQASGTNTVVADQPTAKGNYRCTFVKPRNGVSPLTRAKCVKK